MRYLCLLSILLIPVFLSAQSTSLPLNFSSYAIKLCVAKDQSLALTTRGGEVGLTGSIKEKWARVDVKGDYAGFDPTFDQPNFFNKDTGFVSGFISTRTGKYNIIYHTTNSGKRWQAVNFGQDGWIDDAINLDNGEAWLSVAGSGIAYTTDYGFTWKKFKNPEIKQRFAAVYFNTARQGLIGSLWNMIAYTDDNCNTWKLLPTPLDQHRYSKTNKESRPEFNRVAIYKDYFLAMQENLVFYSHRDSINWVWLPKYSDFYTDPQNSALFFMTNKGGYIRSDSNFIPIHVFEDLHGGYDAKCRNGSLFIVGNNKMIQLTAGNEVVSTAFSVTGEVKPVSVGYTEAYEVGLLENKVYRQKGFSGAWEYMFTLPFSSEKGTLSVMDYNLLVYDRGDDSLFHFSLQGKMIKAFSKAAMMTNFSKAGINKLIFSQGSRGCFHNYSDQIAYNNMGREFGNAVETNHNTSPKSRMPDNEESIEADAVAVFAGKLPLLFDPTPRTTIKDLAFTEDDYEQCRKDILLFKASLQKEKGKETSFRFHQNNLDFDRLLRLVDSIKYIDVENLYKSLMDLTGFWSTTTDWKKMELINNDKTVLTISSNYYAPNAFYFPWSVSMNGYTILSTSMEINRFIQQIYPAFLGGPQKVEVLHKLVKSLYQGN